MTQSLSRFEIILGVTGGIAAYKAAVLCSDLVKHGAAVTVVMTANAQRFVGPLTFAALSGRRVYSSLFDGADCYDSNHIRLTDSADLIVVAPATANIIAKMATGICDDLLSTILCSADCGVLLAPAMNERMWRNQTTMANVETLRQRGCHFVGPESGRLACGDEGIGRMTEPRDIVCCIEEFFSRSKPKCDTDL